MKRVLIVLLISVLCVAETRVTGAGGGASAPTVTVSTSGPVTVSSTGYYYNNSNGAITYNLPPITADKTGSQYCFRNYAGKSGVVTLQLPASTYMDHNGVNGTVAGTFVSAGGFADSVCVVAVSTTQYVAYPGLGTWTNN